MTLTVDAAGAAFNSSTTTVSVKQARQYVVSPDFAKTWIQLHNGDNSTKQSITKMQKGDTTWKL